MVRAAASTTTTRRATRRRGIGPLSLSVSFVMSGRPRASGNRALGTAVGPGAEDPIPMPRSRRPGPGRPGETRLSDGAPDPKLSLPAPFTPPQRARRHPGAGLPDHPHAPAQRHTRRCGCLRAGLRRVLAAARRPPETRGPDHRARARHGPPPWSGGRPARTVSERAVTTPSPRAPWISGVPTAHPETASSSRADLDRGPSPKAPWISGFPTAHPETASSSRADLDRGPSPKAPRISGFPNCAESQNCAATAALL